MHHLPNPRFSSPLDAVRSPSTADEGQSWNGEPRSDERSTTPSQQQSSMPLRWHCQETQMWACESDAAEYLEQAYFEGRHRHPMKKAGLVGFCWQQRPQRMSSVYCCTKVGDGNPNGGGDKTPSVHDLCFRVQARTTANALCRSRKTLKEHLESHGMLQSCRRNFSREAGGWRGSDKGKGM